MGKAAYSILYDREALKELKALRRYHQAQIIAAIEKHLLHQPTVDTQGKIKRLEPPVLANFRLRSGDYRVFYDVDSDNKAVYVIAVRYKGGQELSEIAHDQND